MARDRAETGKWSRSLLGGVPPGADMRADARDISCGGHLVILTGPIMLDGQAA
jgi:hypothetical protein